MKNEAVKQTYLFSCFCGLRTSDIVGLKWKDVFVDRGQYRLAVSMQNHVFDLPSLTVINARFKPWTKPVSTNDSHSTQGVIPSL